MRHKLMGRIVAVIPNKKFLLSCYFRERGECRYVVAYTQLLHILCGQATPDEINGISY